MYFCFKILKILFTLFRSTCFGYHVERNNANKKIKDFKTKVHLVGVFIQVITTMYGTMNLKNPISLCCKWHKSLFVLR